MKFYEALEDIAVLIPEIRKTIKGTNKRCFVDPITVLKGKITTQYSENYCSVGVYEGGESYELFTFYADDTTEGHSVISERYGLFSFSKGDIVEIPIEDENSSCDINALYNPVSKMITFENCDLEDYSFSLESEDDADSIIFSLKTVFSDIDSPEVMKKAYRIMKLYESVLKPSERLDCMEGFNDILKKNWSKNVLYPRISFA